MAEERMTEDISINNNEIQRSESSDRGDVEIYPFPAITKSKVWDFYGFYKIKEGPPLRENLDMTKAVCRLCLKKYINKGNTSHLMGHIKKVHSEMFSTGSVPGAQTTAKSQESRKFKNRDSSTNGRLSQDKQELIDNTLCKLIASRTISPSVVEDELFQTFVELLNPRYKIPSQDAIMRSLEDLSTTVFIDHDA